MRATHRPRRRPHRAGVWAFVAATLLLPAPSAHASVEDYLGKVIGAVRVTIEERPTSDAAVTQVIATVPGQPLTMAAVRESLTHVFSLGRFEGATVDATLEGGRVTLRYDLTPIHTATRILFEGAGAPGVDTAAILRSLRDRFGISPPLGRAADMARAAETALGARGYLHARVTPRARVDHVSERAELTFVIEPNARTVIGDVDIVGTPSVPPADLRKRLALQAGAPFERDRLSDRIGRYIEERRRSGYYEARVEPAVRLDNDDRVAHVTLMVTPGPRVKVVFAGDSLPSDRRDEFVPVAREGSVDEDLLEDSSRRIEDYLRALGYRDATAPHTRAVADGELRITFTVTRGPLYRVAQYEVTGNASVPFEDLAPALGLRVEQPFTDARLDADVSAVEAAYRRRGYAAAKAQASGDVDRAAAAGGTLHVAVRIAVLEGARTIVDSVAFSGNQAVGAERLQAAVRTSAGAAYVPAQVVADRDAILRVYEDLGFGNASVEADPRFNADQTQANVLFQIREGARITIDHILVVGNVRTRTETIERELQVKEGDPFSLGAINESQKRLASLGLFRRARITELRHGGDTTRDLLVTIEEAPPTTIGYGGGVEGRLRPVREAGVATTKFELAPRASFELGRRNLFGSNRSATLFTSVSLHPRQSDVPTSPDGTTQEFTFAEYRTIGAVRSPRIFGTVADASFNVTVEQQIRSSFEYRRASASVEVARRLTSTVSVSGSYQLQRTELLAVNVDAADQPLLNRLFSKEPLRLSSFTGTVIRDTRDDPVNTAAGNYLSANGQIAPRAFGSQVGFAKSFFTAQLFRRLPRTRGVVFAADARLGMAAEFEAATPIPQPERFFAGGDTTVRGFALDQLGVRHVPPDPLHDTIDKDGFPIGGKGLLIFNGELRAPVFGGFGVVGFVDTGNVFRRVGDIAFGDLRTAVGGGIRYGSPVGPLRVDVGIKIDRQPYEGRTAWFVSFGQAF